MHQSPDPTNFYFYWSYLIVIGWYSRAISSLLKRERKTLVAFEKRVDQKSRVFVTTHITSSEQNLTHLPYHPPSSSFLHLFQNESHPIRHGKLVIIPSIFFSHYNYNLLFLFTAYSPYVSISLHNYDFSS